MNDEPKSQITPASVYEEMYNEARRHRDHQFTSSTWFSALLLGVLGFLIATRFGNDNSARHWTEFAEKPLARCVVMLLCVLIALASTSLVSICHRRYKEIRDWLDANLEPDFKQRTFRPAVLFPNPDLIYGIAPWFVVATIALILFA